MRWPRSSPADAVAWERRFFSILQDFKFLPGGRIHAGSGTSRSVTLFNCFVMGKIEDSIPGIFRAQQEGALTMQQGGGMPSSAAFRKTSAAASRNMAFATVFRSLLPRLGTISLLAGNVSSRLEPIFAASYTRKVLAEDAEAVRAD